MATIDPNNHFASTMAYYAENAAQYDKKSQEVTYDEEMQEFRAHLQGNRILDAGCGTGRDASLFAQGGSAVTGLDMCPELLDIARKKAADQSLPIDFVEGDLLNLPFDKDQFDGIWSQASLLHFPTVEDVKKALSEFHRVLSPSGIVHISVKKQLSEDKFSQVDGRFFQFFTPEELTELCAEAGFTQIKLEDYNEKDKIPDGGRDVQWLSYLGKKVS